MRRILVSSLTAFILSLCCLLHPYRGSGSNATRQQQSGTMTPARAAGYPQARHQGFTLPTTMELEFTEPVYWVGEDTATVMLSLTGGGLETNGSGDVSIACISGPYTAPGWSGHVTDNPITVPVPKVPGEYTYQATYSVHTDPNDPDQHDSHTVGVSTTATMLVVDVALSPDPVVVTNGANATLTATIYPESASSYVDIDIDPTYEATRNPNPTAATLTGTAPTLTIHKGNCTGRTRAIATIRSGAVECASVGVLVSNLTVTVAHKYILAGGDDTTTVTATLGDGQGGVVQGTNVTLTTTAGTFTNGQTTYTAATDANGHVSTTLTSSEDPAKVTITAAQGTADQVSTAMFFFKLTGLTVTGAVLDEGNSPPRYAARFGNDGDVVTLEAELEPAGMDVTDVPLTWQNGTPDATDKTVHTVSRHTAVGTTVTVTATGNTETAVESARVVVVKVTGITPVSEDLHSDTYNSATQLMTAWSATQGATTTCGAVLDPEMDGDDDVSDVLNQLLVWYGSGTVDANDATHCAFPRTEPGRTPVQVLCGASDARATLWVIKVTASILADKVPINTDCDWNANTVTAGDTDLDKMAIANGKEDDLRQLTITVEPRDVPVGEMALSSLTVLTEAPNRTTGDTRIGFFTTANKVAVMPDSWLLTDVDAPTEAWIEGQALSDNANDQEIVATFTWGALDVVGTARTTVQARDGQSSAQVVVFTYTTDPQTGVQTLSQEKYAPIGGTVALGVRMQVGAGDRLAQDAQGNPVASTGTIRVKDAWAKYPTGVSAQMDVDFSLTGSGWQELLNPGTTNEAWQSSDAPSECDGTQAATRIFFNWLSEEWNTRKYPSVRYPTMTGDFDPPMGHNGNHSVSLAKLDDVEVTNAAIRFQHHDAQQGGWQAAYAAGPEVKTADVENLVITSVSSSNGTVDYLKYDPEAGSPYHRPSVSFTFEDKGEVNPSSRTYKCWAMIQPTRASGKDFLDLGDIYGYAYAYAYDTATPVSKTLDWKGRKCIWNDNHTAYWLSGEDTADWGTYTYDVIINEVDSNGNLIDYFAYKWPYCLSIGEHHVRKAFTEDNDTELRFNYYIYDYAGCQTPRLPNYTEPTEMQATALDDDIEKLNECNLDTEIGVLKDNNGVDYVAYSGSELAGYPRVLFTGIDNCWTCFKRNHEPTRMLAVNQVTTEADSYINLAEYLHTNLGMAKVDLWTTGDPLKKKTYRLTSTGRYAIIVNGLITCSRPEEFYGLADYLLTAHGGRPAYSRVFILSWPTGTHTIPVYKVTSTGKKSLGNKSVAYNFPINLSAYAWTKALLKFANVGTGTMKFDVFADSAGGLLVECGIAFHGAEAAIDHLTTFGAPLNGLPAVVKTTPYWSLEKAFTKCGDRELTSLLDSDPVFSSFPLLTTPSSVKFILAAGNGTMAIDSPESSFAEFILKPFKPFLDTTCGVYKHDWFIPHSSSLVSWPFMTSRRTVHSRSLHTITHEPNENPGQFNIIDSLL